MILLISSDIHPITGPIDPCSVCSHRVTRKNRLIQCANCSLWVHLSCSGLSPVDFEKFSRALLDLSNVPIFFFSNCHSSFIFKYLQNSKLLIFKNESPKHLSTINNSLDLPNYPQLTFTYPPSASSLSPLQSQPINSPLT